MNFGGKTNDDDSEINLVPMIDVLLVILIFIMIAANFDKKAQISVNLPQAGASAALNEQNVQVEISEKGVLAYNNMTFSLYSDEAAIHKLLQSIAANNPQTQLTCYADKNTPHQHVIRFMSMAGESGLQKIAFGVKPN